MPESSSALSAIGARARTYFALLGWLSGLTLRRFHRTVLLSACASVSGIALHGGALFILARAVGAMQAGGAGDGLAPIESLGVLLRAPGPSALLAAFVALFALGSLLGYLGRSSAIGLESALYRYFADSVIEQLAVKDDDARRPFKVLRRRHVLGTRHPLLKILVSDCRFPGVGVRLALFNITHLGNLVLGLLVLGLHAPLLLPLIATFALLAAIAMYPLSLRASRTTRALEASGAERVAYIKSRLGSALDTVQGDTVRDGPTADEALDAEFDDVAALADAPTTAERGALDGYLALVEQRLRVTELSRVIMSAMAATGIGLLAWLLFAYPELHIASAGSLLVLLLGLRFVLIGIEGGMVTLTTLNRFLPHLLRLRALVQDLEHENRSDSFELPSEFGFLSGEWREGAMAPEAIAGPARTNLGWCLDVPGVQRVSGGFEAGALHCLCGLGLGKWQGLAQFETLAAAADGAMDNAVTQLRDAWATCPDLRKVNVLEQADCEAIAHIVSVGRLPIDAETVQLVAGLASPLRKPEADVVRFLIHAVHLARLPLALMVFEARELGSLDAAGQALLLELFADRAVLLVDHDTRQALAREGRGLLLLSDGEQIVCAVPMGARPEMTEWLLEAILSGAWQPQRQR